MREESKLRESDEKAENVNHKYLKKYFYDIITKGFKKVDKKELQILGIDSIFMLDNKIYLCDEKIAANFINRNLKTFILELSFINKSNKIQTGWFLDEKKANDSYLFCWIDKAVCDKPQCADEILEAQIALVQKSKIVEYLDAIGWSLPLLKLKDFNIREKGNTKFGDINKDKVEFVYSQKYVEKPICLKITRQTLLDISDYNSILKSNVTAD